MLIPGTNIRVDNFEITSQEERHYVFFLTHFHSDHLRGLHNAWKGGVLYTSELTARLLVQRFPDLSSRVVAVELMEKTWIKNPGGEGFSVFFFDANHCPGSVMILIYKQNETILHTGDVRFTRKFLTNYEEIFPVSKRNAHNSGCAIPVDKMILDNTFCDPKYDFPTQEDCFRKILGLIRANQCCRTYMFVYRIGKEELLINLAQNLQTKIVVSPEKLEQMKMLDFQQDIFTTDPSQGFLHLKGRIDLFQMSITSLNEQEPTIFVIPTGFIDKFKKSHPRIHLVNYSSHSSYSELKEFVKAVRPKKLLFSSYKKDYQHENQLIKSYCAVKSSFNFEKDFFDPLGAQMRMTKYLKKAPSSRKSSQVTERKPTAAAVPDQPTTDSSEQERKPLLHHRKFTDMLEHSANRTFKKRSRGAQFRHAEPTAPLMALSKRKRIDPAAAVTTPLHFYRTISREALSLHSEQSIRSFSSRAGLLLRDGKEVSGSQRSGRSQRSHRSRSLRSHSHRGGGGGTLDNFIRKNSTGLRELRGRSPTIKQQQPRKEEKQQLSGAGAPGGQGDIRSWVVRDTQL